jgi:hypothetical protein
VDSNVVGSEDGKLKFDGVGWNDDASPVESWVRSKAIDLGDADKIKELTSIRMGFRGNGLTYRIGWSELETGPITWEPYRIMEEGYPFHNLRTAGRWLFMEIYSNTLNADWELMTTQIIGRVEGTR